ncbi:MAG: hypothetical protein QXW26_04560 [Candidatus Nitrosocaldus sp.]
MRKVAVLMKALVFLIILLIGPSRSANMSDYCYVPPFVGTSVKPNVLIVMDFSGSMQFPAYVPCNFGGYNNYVAQCGSSTYSYNPNQTYSGYFDPDKCYQYSSSFFQEANCNCSNRIGSSSCISGNLLNWITTTRIDIARMVLTGGRTSQSGGNTFLESEGARYTINDSNLKCSFTISATTTTNRRITISNYSGTCPLGNNAISNAQIKIRPSDPNSIRGIIHSFCDTSDLNGQINEKCQLIMEFMVFASDGRYGEMKTGKNATLASLISDINNEQPYYGTPTGEALWEAYDFYKQNNDYSYEANSAYINRGNGNVDPYYDGSGGNSYPVPCRKSFVLLLSDGAWNGSVDPVVPARIMATHDLRSDLSGKQNVYTYAVYAFGDLDPGTSLQGKQAMITTAIFGGFEDIDSNTWPFPFTGIQYPNGSGTCSSLGSTVRTNIQTTSTTYCNSRGVTYPLPQCNLPNNWDPKCAEWDTVGNSSKDGLPYNFFEANDAESLRNALLSAFSEILKRASSGATVATLASRTSISSVVLQPYFYPRYIRQDGTEISWIGFLRSFWVDTKQNLREDTNTNKILEMAGNVFDKIFQFVFDPNANETKVAILSGSDPDNACSMEALRSVNELRPLFDAGCRLAVENPNDRKIYYNKDGNLVEFTTGEASYVRSIWQSIENSVNNDTGASCVIRYLRGEKVSSDTNCNAVLGLVNRIREFDTASLGALCPTYSVSGERTWKLGDIIYSTPSIVSAEPLNIYHLRYNDSTYLEHIRRSQYRNRASFSFISANDGMLHVFRIGSIKERKVCSNNQNMECDRDSDCPGGYCIPNQNALVKLTNAPNNSNTDLIAREEWAFIPRNALPYLVWYGRSDYCHVPTVDYRTIVVDASIGGSSGENRTVNSWRTILVGTMGFGGKAITAGGNTYSSAVFALDLTDWLDGSSDRPTLLWEKPIPDNTLTLSFPAIVRLGDPDKNGEWYVVVGTGPMEAGDKQSTSGSESYASSTKLYFINLRNGDVVRDITLSLPSGVMAAVGDIMPFDVDNDYRDDVLYFGLYGRGNNGNSWGNFYRLTLRSGSSYKSVNSLSASDISTAVDLSSFNTGSHRPPVFGAPNATKDEMGALWVFFGTGKFLSSLDKTIPYNNFLIGFKDDCWNGTCSNSYTRGNMDNTTGSTTSAVVSELKNMCICTSAGCNTEQVVSSTSYTALPLPVSRGWYYQLSGEAIYSKPVVFGGIVDALTFVPPGDVCQMEGRSNLLALYYKSGTPYPRPAVLSPNAVSGSRTIGSTVQVLGHIQAGQGVPPIGTPFQISMAPGQSAQYEKFVQLSSGLILRFPQQVGTEAQGRFILWIEK